MHIKKLILSLSIVLICGPMVTIAQNKVSIIPMSDDVFIPIVMPAEPEPEASPYLEDAIIGDTGKVIIWNQGWDTNIGYKTQIDPTVQINSFSLGTGSISYTANEIRHWGEQTVSTGSSQPIYAKGVILVDKGATIEGGIFEWSRNNQGYMGFQNITKSETSSGWSGPNWPDPSSGQKVWFFIMSDDEQFSSNPITFSWP